MSRPWWYDLLREDEPPPPARDWRPAILAAVLALAAATIYAATCR